MAPPLTPPPSFDRVARPYRLLERLTFGPFLHRARLAHLPSLRSARNALVLGDGDGRFLAALLRAAPHLHATAIDASPAMLLLLRQRCAPALASTPHRLVTLCADALTATARLPPAPAFDLVCTHFFLDCLTQPQLHTLLANLQPHLPPGALWVFSDFRIPPRPGPAHWLARLLVRSLYLAFRLLTGLRVRQLPDHAAALTAAGFALQRRRLSLSGILSAELWQLPHPNTGHPSPHRSTMAHKDDRAPIEMAYDIDLLSPLGPTPNTIPTEVEREILRQPVKTPPSPTTEPDQYNE